MPQAAFIHSATELMSTQASENLRAYFRWQLLRRYSMFLSASYVDASLEFVNRTLQGAKDIPTTVQLAETYVPFYLPKELSAAYMKRYITPAARNKAMQIAENVRAAYRNRITSSSWLSAQSRSEALRKLDTLEIGMLYPDERKQPANVSLRENDLMGNVMKLSERTYDERLRRLNQPPDRREWRDSPISISGSYSVSSNSLTITAGRATPPLFDPAAEDPENYGGLGTLVGHEIGHALDNQGSQYDSEGNHRDWWNADDKREFARRSARLVEQYRKYEPLPGMHLNGQAGLSENIADLVGLTMGYEALELARRAQGRSLTTEDARRFFTAWATRWRAQYAKPFLLRVLTTDTHPPLQYRCTVPLSNFTPFYDVVGIGRDSPAYLAPEQRVSIW